MNSRIWKAGIIGLTAACVATLAAWMSTAAYRIRLENEDARDLPARVRAVRTERVEVEMDLNGDYALLFWGKNGYFDLFESVDRSVAPARRDLRLISVNGVRCDLPVVPHSALAQAVAANVQDLINTGTLVSVQERSWQGFMRRL